LVLGQSSTEREREKIDRKSIPACSYNSVRTTPGRPLQVLKHILKQQAAARKTRAVDEYIDIVAY
jgi:hypothetical protein